MNTKFCKGHMPWNKNKKAPKISLSKLGKRRLDMIGNKYSVGRKHTDEWKANMSNRLKGNKINIGKVQSKETIEKRVSKLRNENNPLWLGGKTRWASKKVKERDNYTCKSCGLNEPDIVEVDHIIPKSIRPDLANSLDNLMTLCPNCHVRKTKKDRKVIREFKLSLVTRS